MWASNLWRAWEAKNLSTRFGIGLIQGGNENPVPAGWFVFFRIHWAGHYSMEFARVHEDIKSLNLKLALHKSRFVEFTVKPEQAGDAATAH